MLMSLHFLTIILYSTINLQLTPHLSLQDNKQIPIQEIKQVKLYILFFFEKK